MLYIIHQFTKLLSYINYNRTIQFKIAINQNDPKLTNNSNKKSSCYFALPQTVLTERVCLLFHDVKSNN